VNIFSFNSFFRAIYRLFRMPMQTEMERDGRLGICDRRRRGKVRKLLREA
jgi:hypothetical protein